APQVDGAPGVELGLEGVALGERRAELAGRLLLELGEEDREHGDGAQHQDEGPPPLVRRPPPPRLPARIGPPLGEAGLGHHILPCWEMIWLSCCLGMPKRSGVWMPSDSLVCRRMGWSASRPRRVRSTRT